ncbi:hypothetical protein HK098_007777 [Nowakowskiella sp. JEL0407]|nr:hypothetical protein HK098_007777 [Nowakowskiella sp. JEL0407]
MENLSITEHSIKSITNDKLLAAVIHDSVIYSLVCDEADSVFLFSDSTSPIPVSVSLPCKVVSFAYVDELDGLILIISSGDILLISTINETVTVMGSMADEILAAEWSLDQQFLLLLTNTTILLFSPEFDVIFSTTIEESLNSSGMSMANVGWGSKKTQFHGREGKEAAKKTNVSQSILDASEEGFDVAWGNEVFMVSLTTVNTEGTKIRAILTFSRTGTLLSRCENVDHIFPLIDYKYNGNLITTACRVSDGIDITYFEKNGLKRSDFKLQLQPMIESSSPVVKKLSWNSDTTIFYVWIETSSDNIVQIYTTKNYKYYLKQQLSFSSISSIFWDAEISTTLHIFEYNNSNVNLHTLSLSLEINASTFSESNGCIAVIDGKDLLLTPFKYTNIPPPMSHKMISFEYPIRSVSFYGNDVIVLLCNGVFQLVTCHGTSFKTQYVKSSEGVKYEQALREIQVVSSRIWCLGVDRVVSFEMESIKAGHLVGLEEIRAENVVKLIPGKSSVYLELKTGEIQKVVDDFPEFVIQMDSSASICTSMFKDTSSGEYEEVIISLSKRNKLFVNTTLVSSDCTSFLVHEDYLVYSTFNHTAEFVKLSGDIHQLVPIPEYSRRLERGAKIILAIPGEVSLILQMPRGNLETVFPRCFVVSLVEKSLNDHQYGKAFVLCRKHRIDMNLIVEHDLNEFLKNVEVFVDQVSEVDDLNLFLSGLSISSKSETLNLICDKIRFYLNKKDHLKYIQPIITSYVRKDPSELENAVGMIQELRALGHQSEMEQALQYTIFLVKVDKLFDVALGLYDFPLVIMVAQHSQKDPKEFLPFLSSLQSLPPHYQHFKIDTHLQKYVSALSHLKLSVEANEIVDGIKVEFDELLKFTKKWGIEKECVDLFKTGDMKDERWKLVCKLAGDMFEGKGELREAGNHYLFAKESKLAIQAFAKGIFWKEAMMVALQVSLPQSEIKEIAQELIALLEDERRLAEAATVAMDYLDDFQMAVSHLIQEMQNSKTTLDTHKVGLRRALEEKARRQAQLDSMENDERLDNIDVASDTSSMATSKVTSHASRYTSATNRTARTAKQRRKMDRKRAAGTVLEFEDEFHVNSINKLKLRLDAIEVEIVSFTNALMLYGYIREADGLHFEVVQIKTYFARILEDVVVIQKEFETILKPAP